jgi:hypothetical protein
MQPLCHAARFTWEGIRANDLALLWNWREGLGHERFARVGSMVRGWRTQLEHSGGNPEKCPRRDAGRNRRQTDPPGVKVRPSKKSSGFVSVRGMSTSSCASAAR